MSKRRGVDADPQRAVFDYVRPEPVPRWVSKRAYSECHHCHTGFRPGHKHNCRLCGQMFCSACTGKYHIPDEYRKKGKKGAVRICMKCRNRCLQRKAEATGVVPEDLHFEEDLRNGRVVIHPPTWVPLNSATNCKKCNEKFKKGHTHHCRTCGFMYCSNCTTKIQLPQAFKKKNKSGPVRVCDMCRYMIHGGGILSEEPAPPSQAVPLPSKKADTITLLRDPQRTFIAEVKSRGTLMDVYLELLKSQPSLRVVTFVVGTVPVFKELWPMVMANKIGDQLLVRPGDPTQFLNDEGKTLGKEQKEVKKDESNIRRHARQMSYIVNKKPEEAEKMQCIALFDYAKVGDETHLWFYAGDCVRVSRHDNDQWWYGETDKAKGWFPASYVKQEEDEEEEEEKEKVTAESLGPPSGPPPPESEDESESSEESDAGMPPPPPAALPMSALLEKSNEELPSEPVKDTNLADLFKSRAKLFE